MGRVGHSKPAKHNAPSNGIRGPKVAKQRKQQKVVIESDSKDKEQSRAVLSFQAEPPAGYTFIPAGNPQLTSALKEFAKRGHHQIYAVTTTPHAARHELSREVHRVGFHFPTQVVSQVCNHYGIRLTSGGKLVEEKDDDKLFMRLYQKGLLTPEEKKEEVRDQVTINTEAKQIIQDLFPNIPDNDLFQIIKTAFQLGEGKVGTADEIPLVRRAQLSVVAHIRHTYSSYDKLLRMVPYSEARHRVEQITLQKLIDWRGDGKDDQQAMDDTLREVVVISDEEDSDEIEPGQLLEHKDLQVQPVRRPVAAQSTTNGRPQSPVEIHSDDEAPRGYRYVPQVVRRYPVGDAVAVSTARQQSRYAVWDRVRQEYRSTMVSQPSRVVERVLIDDPRPVPSPGSYMAKEPSYIPDSAPHRALEPIARMMEHPGQHTYTRGVDGKLYERITSVAQPQNFSSSAPSRRAYTPPLAEYGRQHLDSRQASPRSQHPRLHRRTESFENHDGNVLPSIEGSNGVYASPISRRNPFEENRTVMTRHHNSGAYEMNQRQAPLIDLTNSAEKASKRRRVDGTPPSPYLIRPSGDSARGVALIKNDDNAHPSSQPLIPLENPAASYQSQRSYERVGHRLEPTPIYREELSHHNVSSPRGTVVRQLLPQGMIDPYHAQSSRRIEYVNTVNDVLPPSHRTPIHQSFPRYTTNGRDDYTTRATLHDTSVTNRQSTLPTESATRYVRAETRNPFDGSTQPQYYVQNLPEQGQREYLPMSAPQLPPSRDVRPVQYVSDSGNYQQTRIAQLPPTRMYR